MTDERRPAADPGGEPTTADTIAGQLSLFFDLSRALSLSAAEEEALLDMPSPTVAHLRAETLPALPLDQVKLKRRLDYAIPIMHRMLASLAS